MFEKRLAAFAGHKVEDKDLVAMLREACPKTKPFDEERAWRQLKVLVDKEMAKRFLAGLGPSAIRFTFQFFRDSGTGGAQIFHGTLDEVWSKVLALNTPQQGGGCS